MTDLSNEALDALVARWTTELCLSDGDRAEAFSEAAATGDRPDLWPQEMTVDASDVRLALGAITALRQQLAAAEAAALERAVAVAVRAELDWADPAWTIDEIRALITPTGTTALEAVKAEAEDAGIRIGLRAAANWLECAPDALRSRTGPTECIMAITADEARKMVLAIEVAT